MNNLRFVTLGLLLTLFLHVFDANGQFNISSEIRPRGIIDNGAGSPLIDTINTRYFISQRTRLTFDFQKSKFQMRLTAQDIRVWGSANIYSGTGVFGNSSGLDFHEAWLKINIKKNASIKIGRQEFSYDNQRILSKRNWNQYGLSYDAVLFAIKYKEWAFDMALSYNNGMNYFNGKPDFRSGLYYNTNLIKTLNFIRINKSFGTHVNSSLFGIATGFINENSPTVIYVTGTYGFYSHFSFGNFEIPVDAYYQNG